MPLQDTIRAIREADAERRRRIAAAVRVRRPVDLVDAILREMEEIHLRGGIKVPQAMIPRVERLLAELPPGCQTEFPLRTTITRVMDNLYDVQDCLLSRKDRGRVRLREIDEALEPDRSPAA
ncbi:MAG TPA: hypothetical protein VG245_04345 [Candidatus Dormibacteraeota bacterium]|nr:hypothetical protein [Candidatus Dormibacteraeota bacterium]